MSWDEWLFTRVARGAGPAAMLGPAFQQRERKAMATWKRLTQNLVLFLHIKFEISTKEIRGYVALLMDIPSLLTS